MPKARKKKTTEFDNNLVKSVFLYGNPNKGKLAVLWQMERKYVELINFNIEALMNIPDIYLQLIKNDRLICKLVTFYFSVQDRVQ